MNYYTTLTDLDSIETKELEEIFKKQGYVYRQGQFGSGPGELNEAVIAWVSMHPLLTGLFLNILANRIDALLVRLYKWYKERKSKNKKITPVVNIAIYPKKFTRQSFTVKFRLDKHYSKIEITAKLKEAKNATNR